ncbi:NmrA family NAD(P)-binding protein [Actinomadura sp. WMMB 499]|uniref:NmrA family NAD(P)-binding protein n=1 Tax=Actinomadura sp. WMMB 499 TaxID=1219491 RepID=UPI0012480A8E|nr:NmrA family NAD(P)-binding protein [Actinomadura sp. WMMB 499]QFG24056.1 NmrA family transcriptional regulator [Actinomadura sp. WMMB 499]
MSSRPILVIGSTGKTGRRVAGLLAEGGQEVRRAGRRTDPPFSWERPSTWPAVFDGVGSAYVAYAPDLAEPGAPARIEALTSCAVDSGVGHLVLLSGRGERNAQRCEQIVRESGLSYTLVRAGWFAQNFSEGPLLESVRRGVIAMPAGQVAEPFVDVDDIAEVAVAALTDDRHAGRCYELTGPRLLTFADAAAEISAAAGRPVEYVAVSSEEFRAALSSEAGPRYADLLTDLCAEVFDGRNADLAHGLQDALGREPRDFADFCKAAASAGVWGR